MKKGILIFTFILFISCTNKEESDKKIIYNFIEEIVLDYQNINSIDDIKHFVNIIDNLTENEKEKFITYIRVAVLEGFYEDLKSNDYNYSIKSYKEMDFEVTDKVKISYDSKDNLYFVMTENKVISFFIIEKNKIISFFTKKFISHGKERKPFMLNDDFKEIFKK
jgi:hypothetical protein